MAESINSANIGRMIGGYGGVSGGSNLASILSGLRGTELSNQLGTRRYEDAFGLQKKQYEDAFGLQKQQYDTQVSQWEKTFADAQQKYQNTLQKWGFDTGGGTLPERREWFKDTTGFSQLPAGDPAMNTSKWGGVGRGLAGRGGNFINSNVDLSDPTKALNAARYARSLGFWYGTGQIPDSRYTDIEKKILNSLSGGR